MQEFLLKNLITIIFLLLALYSFIKGFAKGFIKKILSFGSFVITVIVTKVATPFVSGLVKDFTNIESTLSDIIYKTFIETKAYDSLNIDSIAKTFSTGNLGDNIKNNLCNGIANVIINLICGIIVFVVSLFVIRLLLKMLDVVDYIPVVGQLNKLLGGILGVFEMIMIVWIVFLIIRVFDSVPQIKLLIENIRSSFIVGALYDGNLIYNFLSNLFSNFKK